MEIKMLQERIEKKQIQIAKIEKRIAKWSKEMTNEEIEKVTSTINTPYWQSRELLNSIKDADELRCALIEKRDAEMTLKKYQESLAIEINKEKAPKIEVLVNFLNQWREKANNFYHDEAIRLYEAYKEHQLKLESIKLIQDLQVRYDEYRKEHRRYQEQEKNFSPLLRNIRTYREPYLHEDELQKALDREVKVKYNDLVVRMKNAVGEIQDCSNLRIGGNGSINGIISGTNGKAKMETITAGGYNIQCLHYRVLVNPIN